MGALYAVLVIVALGRQKLDHRVNAICATATERSRSKTYRLTDFEFVILHRGPPLRVTLSAEPPTAIVCFRNYTITKLRRVGFQFSENDWDVSGSAYRYNGRYPLSAGGRHALSCLPYDVFDADLSERHSNTRPSSV